MYYCIDMYCNSRQGKPPDYHHYYHQWSRIKWGARLENLADSYLPQASDYEKKSVKLIFRLFIEFQYFILFCKPNN